MRLLTLIAIAICSIQACNAQVDPLFLQPYAISDVEPTVEREISPDSISASHPDLTRDYTYFGLTHEEICGLVKKYNETSTQPVVLSADGTELLFPAEIEGRLVFQFKYANGKIVAVRESDGPWLRDRKDALIRAYMQTSDAIDYHQTVLRRKLKRADKLLYLDMLVIEYTNRAHLAAALGNDDYARLDTMQVSDLERELATIQKRSAN